MTLALRDLADLDGAGAPLLRATVAMGFSEPVARAGLAAEFAAWTDTAVDEVLTELRPADRPRRPQTVLILAAGTLPASALRQTLFARMLGARVLLKPATGQEALARAVAAVDRDVEPCLFRSSDRASLDRAIAAADAVVALGADATIHSIRAATPATKAFVGYGHRLSVAWLDGPVDDDAVAGLAADLCAWDQAGCLSPQVAWTTGDPVQLAERLAQSVRALERNLPMPLSAQIRQARYAAATLAEMTGSLQTTETALIAALSEPRFRLSPGWRTLWVLPAEARELAALGSVLSSVGACGSTPQLDSSVRICRLGHMQRPPLTWPHDGGPNLRPMLVTRQGSGRL